MIMLLAIIKFISLVVAIWFTIINFGSIYGKEDVPAINILVQAVSIAVFAFIHFRLWF